VECKNKGDTSNKNGNWNHLKIIQKIPVQHNGKARNQGTTEGSHTERCARTAGSNDVKVQNIVHSE
jgi:hypothetical protein